MSTRAGFLLLLFAGALSVSCTEVAVISAPITRQLLEGGAVRFEPYDTLPAPLRYTLYHWPLREQFEIMERCSGKTGSFDRIEWYAYPGRSTFTYKGRQINGFWDGSHRIYLAGTPTTLAPPQSSTIPVSVVRHEILHYLIKDRVINHPAEFFGPNGRCATALAVP